MEQADLFDVNKYEYLLVAEPPRTILDCISSFKSKFEASVQKHHFKKPHLSVGHFVMGESNEADALRRITEALANTVQFSLSYVATEKWNRNIHLVFRFESEYFTSVLIPKIKKTIGRNCASGVPHITIMKNGISDNHFIELPENFTFQCDEIILLKRKFEANDSYRILKRFSLVTDTLPSVNWRTVQ